MIIIYTLCQVGKIYTLCQVGKFLPPHIPPKPPRAAEGPPKVLRPGRGGRRSGLCQVGKFFHVGGVSVIMIIIITLIIIYTLCNVA